MAWPPLCSNPRYRLLDAWRGVACLMVIAHHAGSALQKSDVGDSYGRWLIRAILYRGNLGVTIFFVISGYCIAASADACRRKGLSPWKFLARRVRRIYPPYWISIAVILVLVVGLDLAGLNWLHEGPHAVGFDSPDKLTVGQWIANLTLTETLRPHFGGPDRNIFTVVAWSLCFEEQFYLICFLVLLFAPGRLFRALAVVTVVCLAILITADATHNHYRLFGVFPALWHDFAVGVAVFFRLNLAATRRGRLTLDALLLAMLAASLWAGDEDALTSSAFGLLLISLRRWDDVAVQQRWLAPLLACGHRSYSIYLAHLPAVVVGALGLYALGLTSWAARLYILIPVVSVLGVAAGWIFFELVEVHFLNPPLERRPQVPVYEDEAAVAPSPALGGLP